MTGPVAVIGDVLLDRDVIGTADRLAPDAPVPVLTQISQVERPGGAGLAAVFVALAGLDVVLVGAIGENPAGERVRRLLCEAGVELLEVEYDGPTPEKIRLRAGDQPLLRLDRGVTQGRLGDPSDAATRAVRKASAVLVSDYGRGVTALPSLRRALAEVAGTVPVVWDPHPKGSTPVPAASLVCPNRTEAAAFAAAHGADLGGGPVPDLAAAAAEAKLLCGVWRATAVAVTLGPHGAVVAEVDGAPVGIPTRAAVGGDTCGAGDRFSAAATLALGQGRPVRDAVAEAVATASSYVAAGGPASLASEFALEGLT